MTTTPITPKSDTDTVEILPPRQVNRGRVVGVITLCVLAGAGWALLRRSPDIRSGFLPNAGAPPAEPTPESPEIPDAAPPVNELSDLVSSDLAEGNITRAILRLQDAQADPDFNAACATLGTCERWRLLYDFQNEIALQQAALDAKRRDDLIAKAEKELPVPPERTYLGSLAWLESTLINLVAGKSKEDPRLVLNDAAGLAAALESEWHRQEWAIAARANPNSPPELKTPPAGRVNLSNLAGLTIELRRIGEVTREAGIEAQIRAASQAEEAARTGTIPEEAP